MKPITQEWVNKAEGDFATAQRESKAEQNPNYDAVCFHSQQCIEKYLKGCLQEANILFEKTHDLVKILNLLLPLEPNWASFEPMLSALTTYAVESRYPGVSVSQSDAEQAIQYCSHIRQLARQHLKMG